MKFGVNVCEDVKKRRKIGLYLKDFNVQNAHFDVTFERKVKK